MSAASFAVLGDSIALGVAWELFDLPRAGTELQTAAVRAKVGANCNTIAAWPTPQAPVLVVSMGSNEAPGLPAALARVSQQSKGARFVLLLPMHDPARGQVAAFARQNAFVAVPFEAGMDGLHPRSYSALALIVRPLLAP